MKEKIDIKKLLEEFIKKVVQKDLMCEDVDDRIIYNEYSLQHELGKFLENNLPKDYIVLFEKPIGNKNTIKKECDIVIKKKGQENHKYAIELKYPTSVNVERKMFNFLKDIKFMEQIQKKEDFDNTYCLVVANHKYHSFPTQKTKAEINNKYRKIFIVPEGNLLIKNIDKKILALEGEYLTKWEKVCENYDEFKYYIIDIENDKVIK